MFGIKYCSCGTGVRFADPCERRLIDKRVDRDGNARLVNPGVAALNYFRDDFFDFRWALLFSGGQRNIGAS